MTLVSASRFSLARVARERSCWMMPMRELTMAMTRKAMSVKLPAMMSSTASTTNTRLKNVRVFSRMICRVVLVLGSSA